MKTMLMEDAAAENTVSHYLFLLQKQKGYTEEWLSDFQAHTLRLLCVICNADSLIAWYKGNAYQEVLMKRLPFASSRKHILSETGFDTFAWVYPLDFEKF